MKTSEKYVVACVTIMTAAYLWFIYRYSKEVTASLRDEVTVEDAKPAFTFEDKPFRPTVKGLDDGE